MIINNSGEKIAFYFDLNNEKIYIEIEKGTNYVNFYNHLPMLFGVICHNENLNAILTTQEESAAFVCSKYGDTEECECLKNNKIILEYNFFKEDQSIKEQIKQEQQLIENSLSEEMQKIREETLRKMQEILEKQKEILLSQTNPYEEEKETEYEEKEELEKEEKTESADPLPKKRKKKLENE